MRVSARGGFAGDKSTAVKGMRMVANGRPGSSMRPGRWGREQRTYLPAMVVGAFVQKSFLRTTADCCKGAAKPRVADRARVITTAALWARMLTPKVSVMGGCGM